MQELRSWREKLSAVVGRLLTARLANAPAILRSSGPQWVAVLGQRLELGATGFEIRLMSDPHTMPYHVFDPDGRRMAWGGDLQGLKRFAEQHARDRAEFRL